MLQSLSSNSQKVNNQPDSEGVYLGNTRVYEPAPSAVASSPSDINPNSENQEAVIADVNPLENKINRYQRQSASRRLLPKKRVSKCLRARISSTVKVLKSKQHKKCHYGDLVICGSIWDCPVCAGKVSERRRIELGHAVSQWKETGGYVYLITFTYSHQKQDDLNELLSKQSKAMQWFYRHRDYKNMAKRYQKQGRVRALEVNHGSNGWHPHIHELWFLDLHLHDFETLKLEIFNLWKRACARYDLGEPSWEHGVDVRGGGDSSSYIAKFGLEDVKPKVKAWELEHELTKASSKKGRNGSRSAFQLLDDYIEGDKQAGALFVEYSNAFFRKKQLTWSKGLKAVFDLDTLTDEELANQQDDKADILAEIQAFEWEAILGTSSPKHDNRVLLLILAENGGIEAIRRFIDDRIKIYTSSH